MTNGFGMMKGDFKHFYYTLLFAILIAVIILCTMRIENAIFNFADAVNYAADGSLRFNFTDAEGD